MLDNEPMPTSDPTAELLGPAHGGNACPGSCAGARAARRPQGGGAEAGGDRGRPAAARERGSKSQA